MVRRRQIPARPPPPSSTRQPAKKNSAGILPAFLSLFQDSQPAFSQQRIALRTQTLALSSLLCLGRHTLTSLLTTSGLQFQDWSAPYRLFSAHRVPTADLFAAIRRRLLAELAPAEPFTVAIDDSLLPKSGLRIPGAAWRRDPLGPHFQTSFIRAQRLLQCSAVVPLANHAVRLVPVCFQLTPATPKPSRNAPPPQWTEYRQNCRRNRLPLLALQQIAALRKDLDSEPGGAQRQLQCVVDGGYTNGAVLKKLPERTTLIGRIRKDAKLYFPAEPRTQTPGRGRPRRYGAPAPTPEQLRTDETLPWSQIEASVGATRRLFRVKSLGPVLWRTAGLGRLLQLVVIAPLGYQLRKGSKLLYRQPAFLICTDPGLALAALVQSYLYRWGIEVNFREEKTLLGVGQAQVRHPNSVESLPALQVAAYAMLQLACLHSVDAPGQADLLPPPKWAARQTPPRFSTRRAISQLRAEVWGHALQRINFSPFSPTRSPDTKPEKFHSDLTSAVLYASN